MNYKIIFVESLIWSVLWIAMLSIGVRKFPFTLEHDYPPDVREAANIQKPSNKEKRLGIGFSVLSILTLFSLLVAFGVLENRGEPLQYSGIFFHI